MREKFYRFMQGRYGNDRFNQFLMILALVCLVISLFGPNIFYLFALAAIAYSYFRMFSRKIYARSAENQRYLKMEGRVRGFLSGQKKELAQRKNYHIYKCPNCKQKIRIPRGHGKIEVRCPKCSTCFIKRS